jgi:hypothetical protein
VLFSQNKPAPAISHQSTEHAGDFFSSLMMGSIPPFQKKKKKKKNDVLRLKTNGFRPTEVDVDFIQPDFASCTCRPLAG